MNDSSQKFDVFYSEDAIEDMKKLDHSVRARVAGGIEKASYNPYPKDQGGYGKRLGNKCGINLSGLLEIKFRGMGIRAVYKLVIKEKSMEIIVVSVREDEIVFKEAFKRMKK